MRQIIAALIVIGSLFVAPLAAQATNYPLKVVNRSDRDSWVTVYWAYHLTGWHIERAFCLKPGQKWDGGINYSTPEIGPQIKVRAEVMHGDCRSGVYRDVEGRVNIPTNIRPYPYVGASINGSGGNYNVEVKATILPN